MQGTLTSIVFWYYNPEVQKMWIDLFSRCFGSNLAKDDRASVIDMQTSSEIKHAFHDAAMSKELSLPDNRSSFDSTTESPLHDRMANLEKPLM